MYNQAELTNEQVSEIAKKSIAQVIYKIKDSQVTAFQLFQKSFAAKRNHTSGIAAVRDMLDCADKAGETLSLFINMNFDKYTK
jgi:hypothetical protein